MSIIKCKMCGGDIELAANKTFGTCEYCGSIMTLPKVDDDQRAAAFNRGNHFRRQGEFDKALAVYERIVAEDDNDAEAHWCCALCRFGIEYVEDPATYEWLPTCHRASFDSILEDVDYLAAIEHSEGITKRQYQKEAVKIAEVQRGILATSQNEEPFDVFICYKESEENGERTRDSILAQEIYYQLTEQGRRVFFARITLEDKAGSEYEPYIFAALNSAKVMVAVGTTPEHFNAVWVKNEWSRFLALMRKDRSKLLLPCYRDMDPYDLPEQLSVLQSYDMAKIGFIQDLIRGINKVLDAEKKPEPQAVKETVVVQQAAAGGTTAGAQVQRGNMALEDHEWDKADSFFEEALNLDPQCAEAYLGKALAAEKCQSLAAFMKKIDYETDEENSYELNDLEDTLHITEMVEKYAVKNYLSKVDIRNLYQFSFTVYTMTVAREHCRDKALASFDDNRNINRAVSFATGTLKQQLKESRAELEKQQNARLREAQEAEKASCDEKRAAYQQFLMDTDVKVAQMHQDALEKREKAYQNLVERFKKADSLRAYEAVKKELYWTWSGDKDGDQLAEQCDEKIETINAREAAKVKVRNKIIKTAAISIVAVAGVVTLIASQLVIPTVKYHKAEALLESEDYQGAKKAFMALDGFKDSEKRVLEANRAIDKSIVSGGRFHAVGLHSDGTVVAVGDNASGQCNVSDWTEIMAVSAGFNHTIGLKTDGTVVATGSNGLGQCDVSSWTEVVAISAGKYYTIALKSNGTVVSTGDNQEGQCNVSGWTDIVAVSAGANFTVGLKANGTVVAVGKNEDGQCDVSQWTDIVAISAGTDHTIGLKSDGTVVIAGKSAIDQRNVSDWTDIVAISAGDSYTVGLRSDGTVVAVGKNEDEQCDVSRWTDIVAISAGDAHTIGLKSDGTVVAVGKNIFGQCDVSGWRDIQLPQ